MKNTELDVPITSLIWVILIVYISITFQKKINKLNYQLQYYKQQLIHAKTYPDSVVINCNRCNSRNVRYILPDSLFTKNNTNGQRSRN